MTTPAPSGPTTPVSRRAVLYGSVSAMAVLAAGPAAGYKAPAKRARKRRRATPATPPKPVKPLGYSSVAAMLASPQFYVAHRGGSADWPEMSKFAYDQAASWGAGALEISLHRTLDGVWVGVHDDSLDRTSGTSNVVVTQRTWAEVQQYRITAAATNNPGQAPQPYLRWEELVNAYYATHVLFVDPKSSAAHVAELLTMMDSLPGAPTTRIVAKSYGVSESWPQQARQHGYQTWGYFYEADVPQLATYQARWDILGMAYQASPQAWATALSYGKVVIGHICPDAAAVSQAFARGARGAMVSGVVEGVPRAAR